MNHMHSSTSIIDRQTFRSDFRNSNYNVFCDSIYQQECHHRFNETVVVGGQFEHWRDGYAVIEASLTDKIINIERIEMADDT